MTFINYSFCGRMYYINGISRLKSNHIVNNELYWVYSILIHTLVLVCIIDHYEGFVNKNKTSITIYHQIFYVQSKNNENNVLKSLVKIKTNYKRK